jgi:hypothetical protein
MQISSERGSETELADFPIAQQEVYMLSDTRTTDVGGVLALSEAMTEYAYPDQTEPAHAPEVFDQPVLDARRACD